MNDIMRLIAMTIVWGIVGSILLASALNNTSELVPMTFILGIAATGSTAVIWNAPRQTTVSNDAVSAAKQKRNNRLSRMVEKLDDDEMAQLEDLLVSRQEDSRLRDYE